MIITSAALLVVAAVLLVTGALHGSPTLLGASLGAAAAGGLALLAGNASVRRAALARGVPPEAVLATRLRRPAREAAAPHQTDGRPAEATPPPIDGYDEMPAREITRLVSSGAMPDEGLSQMLVYEASHRRRRAVLTALLDAVGPDAAAARGATPRRRRPGSNPTEGAAQRARSRVRSGDQDG